MGQTAVAIARAIGPAMATSMYAYCTERQILGGQAVFIWLMILAVVFRCVIPSRLPDDLYVRDE